MGLWICEDVWPRPDRPQKQPQTDTQGLRLLVCHCNAPEWHSGRQLHRLGSSDSTPQTPFLKTIRTHHRSNVEPVLTLTVPKVTPYQVMSWLHSCWEHSAVWMHLTFYILAFPACLEVPCRYSPLATYVGGPMTPVRTERVGDCIIVLYQDLAVSCCALCYIFTALACAPVGRRRGIHPRNPAHPYSGGRGEVTVEHMSMLHKGSG
mmetsp:Transcript_28682/g.51457  ORF Transcript_28682/g.51457 Transcript_28682/m.51457 type:complete len:206 (-) Transcript_28682:440-1057(-)